MQKQLTTVAILSLGLSAIPAFAGGPEIIVEPDYFSGFFVGATGAFHATGFEGNTSATSDSAFSVMGSISEPDAPVTIVNQLFFPAGVLSSADINGNSYDGYYGGQVGVGKVFNHRWYAGVVGFGEWGTQQDTSNQTTSFFNNNASGAVVAEPTTGSYQSSTTMKLSNDYGVAFKPGFLVAPRTMVYGKVGAVWAKMKISNSFSGFSEADQEIIASPPPVYVATATLSGSSTKEQTKTALLLGLGVEQFIYRDFITLNVEYNYENFGSITTTTPLTGQGSVTVVPPFLPTTATVPGSFTGNAQSVATARAKVSTLLAGLNFYFGSQWF